MAAAIPIPHPIHFVFLAVERWRDVFEASDPPAPEDVAERIVDGTEAWILQTYLILRRRGHDVRLSDRFVPDAICVAHFNHLQLRLLPWQSYVIAVRPDRGRVFMCEQQIVQNPGLATRPREHFVPHWPQPGLVPRNPARGSRVERVGFFGREKHLAARFRTDAFRTGVARLGLEFVVRTDRWTDYRDLDVVLAVRDGRPRFLSTKPATKLVNAWIAGCPALLGPEPAYQSLRTSELDFLEISTPEQAFQALARLQSDPELHRAMLSHGRDRAREFTRERIAERWEALLAGPVATDFERWRAEPLALPRRGVRFAARAFWQSLHPNRYRR